MQVWRNATFTPHDILTLRADAGLDDGDLLPEDVSDAKPHPGGMTVIRASAQR